MPLSSPLRTQESSVTLSPLCLCPRTDGTVAPRQSPPNTVLTGQQVPMQ
nr:hypothetical protein Iba_chr11cCG13130 [Ipomoea batatas]GMD55830.1 hypothetical protein Iba_chr11dCG11740 [Ipomoea batatas]